MEALIVKPKPANPENEHLVYPREALTARLTGSSHRSALVPPPLRLAAFTESYRAPVTRILKDLPLLYPNGDKWLQRRLDDVLDRRAKATVALIGKTVVGVTIETPKGRHKTKLSTILVPELMRGRGIGSSLIESCIQGWQRANTAEAIVTVRLSRAFQTEPLLRGFGFQRIGVAQNRYGDTNDEVVLRWTGNRGTPSCANVDEIGLRRGNLCRY